MAANPWILISVLVLLIILGVIAFFMRKKEKQPIDYYNWYIIGLVWLPLGIIFQMHFFFILGLVFMGVGLANKDKWKANRRTRKDMTPEQRKFQMILIIALGVLLVLGIVAFLLVEKGIL